MQPEVPLQKVDAPQSFVNGVPAGLSQVEVLITLVTVRQSCSPADIVLVHPNQTVPCRDCHVNATSRAIAKRGGSSPGCARAIPIRAFDNVIAVSQRDRTIESDKISCRSDHAGRADQAITRSDDSVATGRAIAESSGADIDRGGFPMRHCSRHSFHW